MPKATKITLPSAKLENKSRAFAFDDKCEHAHIGRCSGYWTLADDRKCISELTIDRSSNIFETYFFSKIGLENLTATQLFDMVKSGHLQYDHDDSIQFAVRSVKDDVGNIFWAVEVLIANSIKLIRKRPPFFEFYEGVDVPQASRWTALKGYMDAQRNGIPFLLIEGETGSPSWKDSDTHRIVRIGSEAALIEKLKEKPTTLPITDYTSHNLGIIDARDLSRPFNHTTYHPAKYWPV